MQPSSFALLAPVVKLLKLLKEDPPHPESTLVINERSFLRNLATSERLYACSTFCWFVTFVVSSSTHRHNPVIPDRLK